MVIGGNFEKGLKMTEFEQTKLLAEQGYAKAQGHLGWMYYNGRCVKQDYAEAVRWYAKAAEQGNAPAQYNLASAYFCGLGVEQNDALAVDWYKKSAEQGHARAQYWFDRVTKEMDSEKEDKPVEQGHASEKDNATSPSHYKQGGVECIDAIRSMTSAMHGDGFKIACLKDVVKYVWRHEFKDGLEDLKKAHVYLAWAIEQMENEK